MPQDVAKRVSAQRGTSGMLRVRTSPDFEVAEAYGRLFKVILASILLIFALE